MLRGKTAILGIFCVFLFKTASTYPSYPNCPALSSSDFRHVNLIDMVKFPTIWEPVQLVIRDDGNGNMDIFFTERRENIAGNEGKIGRVKWYHAASEEITTILEPAIDGHFEDGLVGISFDPKFSINGWIYLYYSHGGATAPSNSFRLSRFTFDGTVMDPASEQIILEIPREYGGRHTGGSMAFDNYGNLWFGVGDNDVLETGAGCSSDLRGSIIRIKPLPVPDGSAAAPGIGSTYEIPDGNFSEHFSGISADYSNPAKVRPEIYAMGARNPYNVNVQPVKQWVTWADCGPDGWGVTEEHNLATEPGFFGWPWFAGDNVSKTGGNPASPTNGACGAFQLPPATPAINPYIQACAMGGPIYQYDPNLNSQVKFPPHFHDKWLIADWNNHWVKSVTLNEGGTAILGMEQVFQDVTLPPAQLLKPMDLEFGPDGALYINSYGGYFNSMPQYTRITRIEYVGPECAVGPEFVRQGCMDPTASTYDPSATQMYPGSCVDGTGVSDRKSAELKGVFISSRSISFRDLSQDYDISVLDANGSRIFEVRISGQSAFTLPGSISRGIYTVKISGHQGQYVRRAVLL